MLSCTRRIPHADDLTMSTGLGHCPLSVNRIHPVNEFTQSNVNLIGLILCRYICICIMHVYMHMYYICIYVYALLVSTIFSIFNFQCLDNRRYYKTRKHISCILDDYSLLYNINILFK